MSHYKIFVLKNVNEKNDTVELDEDRMYEEMKYFADYVQEEEIDRMYLKWLEDELKIMFGDENVRAGQNRFTVTYAGAIHYFEALRERVHRAIQTAMLYPVEDFVQIDLEKPGWWQIKEMLESHYDTNFYLHGFGCETKTRFAEDVLWIAKKDGNVTLELSQVFDFHV